MIRRARILFGAALWTACCGTPASGQSTDEGDSPEIPTWRAPAAPGVSSDDDSDDDDSSAPEGDPSAEPADPSDETPSDAATTVQSTQQPPAASILEPTATPTLGVPKETGWGLPDFSEAGSWFQAEGLRLRLGPFQLRFSLDTNFGYNDNIFGTNTPKIGDYLTTVAPTLEVGLGNFPRPNLRVPLDEKANYFLLSYTPSFQYFAINTTQNTVNESLGIAGRYSFSRLAVDGSLSYIRTSNPTPADVGRQEYSTYTAQLKGSYILTPKTFFQLTLNGSYQDYANLPDSRSTTVSVAPAFGYVVGSKLKLTLGPVAGITYIGNGGEQPFQTVQVGFTYDTLRKLLFRGMFGIQATQFQGNNPSGSKDFTSPVFTLGATYTIDATSAASLDLNRTISTAGTSNGQTYISTALSLGYQKRFWERIQLDFSGSLQSLNYQGGDSRTDTYLSASLRLGYLFWENRCNTYVIYTRNQRFSENTVFEYQANFFGTGINVQF